MAVDTISNYLDFVGRLEYIQYRNDLDSVLNDIHAAKNRGDITGPQEQKLEVFVDKLRQLPSYPESLATELPNRNPVFSITGGKSRRRRSTRSRRRRTSHRRRR